MITKLKKNLTVTKISALFAIGGLAVNLVIFVGAWIFTLTI